jgi:hypothetical protein
VILTKISYEAILNKKMIPALTNCGRKYPAPVFGIEKMLQNSMACRDRVNSPRRSAGLIFRD